MLQKQGSRVGRADKRGRTTGELEAKVKREFRDKRGMKKRITTGPGEMSDAEETISRPDGVVLKNIIRLFFIEWKRVAGIIMLFVTGRRAVAGGEGVGKKYVISVTVGFACPRRTVSTCRR